MLTRIGLAIALVFAVGACDDDSSIVGGPAADAEAAGTDVGNDIADQVDDEFSDNDDLTLVGQTGSILRALNDGEIAQADLALKTLARVETETYASDLIAAHTQANADVQGVLRAYGVGFISTDAEAMLVAEANAGLDLLQSTPPEQIDLVFLELQIRMHSAAEVLLDELESENDTDPMDSYLATFHDMIDEHLDAAEQIHDDLD